MCKRIIIAALVLVAPCSAQSVAPGMRVRAEAASVVHGTIDGTVIAPVVDSLTLAAPGRARLSIPLSAVTHLEAYRGRSVRAGVTKGATWGAIVGVPLGLPVHVAIAPQRGRFSLGVGISLPMPQSRE